ncbi:MULTISPECIES: bacteriocin immunity protein [unclassified Pseudomonas]|uniref:bacteriocin immunity protein n=1 Tax=unclassified Pseudomonas TaxID=196821 RepID=UPI0021BBB526|nr:bacteriocin immunity protein [Pseudomonas sp. HD6422]MCT8167380.1 bacteriocin immunity protein [Pseudomonas sp. HD6422]MCT8186292.1 bacteriocin immunity protein [Pseudomonas sp. HD6421]
MKLKNRLEDYTEQEFLEFLEEFFENKNNLSGDKLASHMNQLVNHFEQVTEHPAKSELIFHPAADVEDSPHGILKILKAWRAANGKPGFKAE